MSTEYGGVWIDGDVVLDGRVSLLAAIADLVQGIGGQRLSAEGNTLVDADVVADAAGFADDDTGAVVDEEVLSDSGSGVYVDAGSAVGPLGHDAWDQRYLGLVEFVGDSIGGDGLDAWVAKDDFVEAFCGRISGEGSGNVTLEVPPNLGYGAENLYSGLLGADEAMVVWAIVFIALVAEGALGLLGEVLEDLVKEGADDVWEAGAS